MGISAENPSSIPTLPTSPPSVGDADIIEWATREQRNDKVAEILANLPHDTWETFFDLVDKEPKETKERASKITQLLIRLPQKTWETLLNLVDKEPKEDVNRNGKEPCSATTAVLWELKSDWPEHIFGDNEREVVSGEKVAVGGHLRGVVKVTSKFLGGQTAVGTGVLVNERTVAMAGHLLFIDKDPAKSVEIFAGMDGSSGSVESRHGIYAVVPRRWYANALKENDVGFIHIDEAFNAVAPMKIGKTPAIGKGTVYGYPGDMPDYGKGKHLCKSTSLMKYEPHETAGMVEHNADTEKGNSGGPVLDDHRVVRAIHRGWGHKPNGEKINHAVAIDREGNDFAVFVAVLDYMVKNERKHTDGNGHTIGHDDFMAMKEGDEIKVEMIGQVEEVGGFAFQW